MSTLGYGFNRSTGEEEVLTLSPAEREQSTYVIGTTGTGKTTLLRNLVVQDMYQRIQTGPFAGEYAGVCVLDPHGDMTEELLGWVPEERIDDVVYLNPMDTDCPFGLNLLDCDRTNEHEVRWVVSTVMETLHRLYWYSWGPRLEHVLRNSVYTTLKLKNSTMVDLLLTLTDWNFRNYMVGDTLKNQKKAHTDPEADFGLLDPETDKLLISFWHDWFYRLSPSQKAEVTASTINKLSPFLLDVMMRNIIGQPTNTFSLTEVMDKGKILLFNLSKGDIGEDNSALLGSVLVNLILIAALRRRGPDYKNGRRPFHLIVDEYQNFANPSFSILQSEARKFGVDVLVAHQYRDQLDPDSKGASLNVGNIISFRVSGRDSTMVASQFNNQPPEPDMLVKPFYQVIARDEETEILQPAKDDMGDGLFGMKPDKQRPYNDVEAQTANELSTLNNYTALARLIRKQGKQANRLQEFILMTYPEPQLNPGEYPTSEQREETKAKVIKLSRERYCRPRGEVEALMFSRSQGILSDQYNNQPSLPSDDYDEDDEGYQETY